MMELKHCCDAMAEHLERGEIGLVFLDKLREYGLEYKDGGSSIQIINYCPWCGKELPRSVREEWFSELEAAGIDPWSDALPSEFNSAEWWIHKEKYK